MPAKTKITEDVQFAIERMILLWSGKLTWALLVHRIKIEIGIDVTRQSLKDYKGIYAAYTHKKELLRGIDSRQEPKLLASETDLIQRLQRLEADLEIAKKTINEQKRFLQRILQNAAELPSLRGNLDLLIAERPEDKF